MAKLFRAAIMGPPGSGKGTISKRIAQSFGLQYLSSGHYLRESIAANTGRIQLFISSSIDVNIMCSTGRSAEKKLLETRIQCCMRKCGDCYIAVLEKSFRTPLT